MGKIIVPDNSLTLPKIGLAGYYRMRTHKYKSGKLGYDTGWFPNLITDGGIINWNNVPSLNASGEAFGNLCVGTGNATPTTSDTQLASLTAYVAANTPFSSTGYVAASPPTPAYWWGNVVAQFGTGVAAGNLAEVGVYPAQFDGNPPINVPPNGYLFSRALILDSNGNPTTITVLSDEILTVTWQLRFYLDLTDHAFTFNLNGSPITGVYRMSQASIQRANLATGGCTKNSNWSIQTYTGDIVSALSGTPTGNIGTLNQTLVTMNSINFTNDLANTGTCYVDRTVTARTSDFNGTWGSFIFQNLMWSYQFGNLSSPIIKTSGQQLQMSFRTAWGRYSP